MTRRMVPKISELQLLLPVPVQFGFFFVLFVGWQLGGVTGSHDDPDPEV